MRGVAMRAAAMRRVASSNERSSNERSSNERSNNESSSNERSISIAIGDLLSPNFFSNDQPELPTFSPTTKLLPL
jgi:hypothetical protein